MFLGEDLLVWLVLAIGGAMAVGNLMAIIRPPVEKIEESDLAKAPLVRSIVFIVVGIVASIWAIASLISG